MPYFDFNYNHYINVRQEIYDVLNSPTDKLPQPLTADQVNSISMHCTMFDEII